MKLAEYLSTWKGALAENKFSRYIILTLSIMNLVLVLKLIGKDETIVLVPPELNREAKISSKNASAGYREAWATHVAMMLGNVTPRSASYLADNIGKIMSPAVYRQMMDMLTEQTSRIIKEQLTIQFTPTTVFYIPEKDVVVVSGEYIIRGLQNAEMKMLRTYEIGVDINGYMVRVDSLNVYEGAWNPSRNDPRKVEEKRAMREAQARSG